MYADSIGSIVQEAGRLSAMEALLRELSAKRAQLDKRQEVIAKHHRHQEETGVVHGEIGGVFT